MLRHTIQKQFDYTPPQAVNRGNSTGSKLAITFLGTGPAVAIPRFGHNDPTCHDAHQRGSKTSRLRSSLLVSYKNINILIDAGPDFLKQAIKIKGSLDAVFLTHEHLDAVGGLHALRAWAATKKLSLPLYCLRETWKKIADDFTPLKPNFVKVGRPIKIGNLMVIPFRVRHGIKHNVPTLGFSIQTAPSKKLSIDNFLEGRKFIIYASDVDGAPRTSRKFFRQAPLVIIDSAMWFGRKLNGHFNPEQAIKFLRPLKPQKVILTQIGHSWPPYKKAIKRLNDFCKKNKTPFPVSVAYDNLELRMMN